MEVGLQSAVFIFGTIVGSFLNVVLLRKNTGETIINGRSRCFSCNKIIVWYDNIPILSYFVLGGRCRWCNSKISWQYPIVEFLVGLLAILIYTKNIKHQVFDILFDFGAFSALFAVAAYDARTKIIDRHLLYIFVGFSCVVIAMRWFWSPFSSGVIFYDIVSAGAIWFFFWAMCYFSNETWMGRGDSAVAWWCAIFLGYPLSVAALLFSFWIGGIFGAFLLTLNQVKIFNKKRQEDNIMKMQIPFAPFLALGTFFSWYFADILMLVYETFLW